MTTTLHDLGEVTLLAWLRRTLGSRHPGVPTGVGDDAAVLRTGGRDLVLTTDALVEGVDFKLAPGWSSWADVGHKAVTVNLSDLAAMGARPRGILLTLVVPPATRWQDLRRLVTSASRVARARGAPIIGGDLSSTAGPTTLSVTAVGEVRRGRALLRHQGRAGDVVLVSGTVGASAAGLLALERGLPASSRLLTRHRRPEARVDLGLRLAQSGLVRSAADVSDGLLADAQHLAKRGCHAVIDPQLIPIDRAAADWAMRHGVDAARLGLYGGEDFELVVAVAREDVGRVERIAARCQVPMTVVGEVVRGSLVRARRKGFDHFGVRQEFD